MENNNSDKPGAQENASDVKPAGEYIKAVRAHIRAGQRKQAYAIIVQALLNYPDHPIVLSYYGWLQADLDKKYQSALTSCRKAFTAFKTSDRDTARIIFPVLYLNLGKVYLAAGRKKEAVVNFNKGLSHDRGHIDLKKEMKLLGTRKEPVVPFLSRSNPINKYMGKLLQTSSPK